MPATRKDRKEADTKPKVFENTKKTLILNGPKTSSIIKSLLVDLHLLKRPHTVKFTQTNPYRPFVEFERISRKCQQKDTSMMLYGSHSKKRPHNLVIGRMFDFLPLDLYEFGVSHYRALGSFPGDKIQFGAKPLIMFQGDGWTNDLLIKDTRSLFLDLFRGQDVTHLGLEGVGATHAVVLSADAPANPESSEPRHIAVRIYRVHLLKGARPGRPAVRLSDHGPHFDLTTRRVQAGDERLRKASMRRPKTKLIRSGKSLRDDKKVSYDALGQRVGKVYPQGQSLDGLALRKFKGRKGGHDEGETHMEE